MGNRIKRDKSKEPQKQMQMLRIERLYTIEENDALESTARENTDLENTAFIMKNNLSIADVRRQERLKARAEQEELSKTANVMRHHRDSSCRSVRSSRRCHEEIVLIDEEL